MLSTVPGIDMQHAAMTIFFARKIRHGIQNDCKEPWSQFFRRIELSFSESFQRIDVRLLQNVIRICTGLKFAPSIGEPFAVQRS